MVVVVALKMVRSMQRVALIAVAVAVVVGVDVALVVAVSIVVVDGGGGGGVDCTWRHSRLKGQPPS